MLQMDVVLLLIHHGSPDRNAQHPELSYNVISLQPFSRGEITYSYSSSGDGRRDELHVKKLKTLGYAIGMQTW
jgi:hypothetical protein